RLTRGGPLGKELRCVAAAQRDRQGQRHPAGGSREVAQRGESSNQPTSGRSFRQRCALASDLHKRLPAQRSVPGTGSFTTRPPLGGGSTGGRARTSRSMTGNAWSNAASAWSSENVVLNTKSTT